MSVNLYNATSGELERIAGAGEIPRWKGTQVEWNTLDKSTLSDGTYVEIIDDVVTLPVHNVYSTDETPIGTWINGKPIYRKCVYIDSIASTSDTHAVADFDMSNIDCIVSGSYCGLNGTIWYIGFYGRLEEGGSAKFLIQLDNNKIYMVNRHTIRKFSFIVEYTKTTD